MAKWRRSVAGVCLAAACAASAGAATFLDQDIGTVAAAGSVTASSGTYTVNASGADIWGNADAFHFMYQAWTGDGTFVTRVTGMTNTDPWAKAGLMIRQDLTPGSPHMFLCTNPALGDATFYRLSPGGPSTFYNYQSALLYSPVWLKLVRAGDVMTSYFSADGLVWQLFGSSTVPMPATVYVGVAVTSHADGTLCTTTFDHLNLADAPPTGLTAAARSSSEIDLGWSDNSARETGFEVERSTDNINFSLIATTSTNAINFVDSGAVPLTIYYYRVRYASANGPSAYTNVASATTTAVAPAGWTSSDIDVPSVPGQITSSGGIFTVQGSGAGVGGLNFTHISEGMGDLGFTIVGAYDQIQLASKPWSADGELVARITSLSGPAGSEAGIMLRSDLTASALNVFLEVHPGGGLSLSGRNSQLTFEDGTIYPVEIASGYPLPLWLRLVRSSGIFTASESADGTNWTQVGSIAISMLTNIYAGLAVSSGQDGTYAFGTFDNVAFNDGQTLAAPPQVAAPTFSPAAGTYTSAQNVTIASATSGVSIRYTLDGSVPTTTTGAIYSGPITVSNPVFIRAIAYESGFIDSTLTSGDYFINIPPPQVAAPTFSPGGGIYSSAQNVTITSATGGASIRYTTDGSTPAVFGGTLYSGPITVSSNETLTAVAFENGFTNSNVDGSFYTFSTPLTPSQIAAPTFSPGSGTYPSAQTVTITSVTSGASIRYTTDGSAPTSTTGTLYSGPITVSSNETLTAIAYETGSTGNNITSGVYTISSTSPPPQTVEPRFSPGGGTYSSAQNVSIFSSTSGASIRYTTDGSVPTSTTGTLYSGPINISSTTTLNAIAYAAGHTDSAVFSGIYTISSPPPGAWADSDIGNVGVAGGFAVNGGTLSVRGSGADIWDSADAFHFASQPLQGDGTIVAQVTSLDNTNGFAKAGVMVRQSLAADSPNAFVFLTPGQGAAFQTRAASGGMTTFNAGPWWATTPYWVKLVRSGNTFSAYTSPDGTTWTLVTTQTVAMTAAAYVGLAVTSHNNSVSATGVFTNVTVTGSGAPPPPSQVAAPTFSPGGGTYAASQNVTISTTTSGASIRYTTNGSAPTSTTGTIYSGPVNISSTTTLNAIAYETGFTDSTVASGIYTISSPPPQVATPIFSPGGGYYGSTQVVTITSATSGATIRYTTDGSTPSETAGTLYSGPVSISPTLNPLVLKAIAFESGFVDSTVISDSYASGAPPPPPSTWADSDIGNVGVAGGFVISGGNLSVRGSGADIWDSADAFHFAYQPLQGDGTIVAQVTSLDNTNGYAKAGVMVRQSLAADSPNAFVFLTPGQGAAFQTRAASGGTTTYNAGPWWVSAPYWVKLVRSGNTFSAYTSPDGTTWTLVTTQTVAMTAAAYVGLAVTSHNNSVSATGVFTNVTVTGSGAPPPPSQVAAPTFNPGGGTYAASQNVTITSATSGASIRYTTNGSAPTSTTGTIYSGPVNISSTETLTAIAYETGFTDSTVASGIYTINTPPPQVAAPTFSPAGGTYSSAQTVTITSATSGAYIRYTTDGSLPTGGSLSLEINGTFYSGPVSISGSMILKAIAFDNGFADSNVTSSIYTIGSQVLAPILNVLANTLEGDPSPEAIIQGSDGNLYGTTSGGGSAYNPSNGAGNYGTVFKMTPAGVLTTLVSFTGTNGYHPNGLVQGSDGNFYSTTFGGGSAFNPSSGAGNYGTVFKMTPAGVLTTLVSFTGTNGAGPNGLVQGSDGNFYGATSGSVFKMTPAGVLTTLISTDGTDPINPHSLVQGSNGNFYFTTVGTGITGSNPGNPHGIPPTNDGTIFMMTPAGVLTTLVLFHTTTGEADYYGYTFEASLVQGSDGNFYGTKGSSPDSSVIFQLIMPPPPPSTWADSDIGNVGVAGGFNISGSTLSVSGSGADIWDSADAFHFTYQPWHGDGEIIAQVAGLDNTNAFAKAGIMFRQSLAADSPNAFVFLTPGEGAAFQTRATSGGTTTFNAGPWWVSAPYWVKLVRSANTFSAYTSPDGTTWTLVTTQTIAMTADVYVGFAVTSHNNSVSATANFTDFMVDVP